MAHHSKWGRAQPLLSWRWGAWRYVAAAVVVAVVAGGAGLGLAGSSSGPGAAPVVRGGGGATVAVAADPGWMPTIDGTLGVTGLWGSGATGAGVGVALIDTGVAAVPGLTSGNVIQGPDLSTTAGIPGMVGADAYGHGTFMAGIIAGRDNGIASGTEGNLHNATAFVGVAPDATLVNVKVGASDGSADPSQIIAALDWVAAHHSDLGVNIRVVNLSYGSESTQSYLTDPVAAAVERVWKAGVVVDVAAGNGGEQNSLLTDPAIDPYVIAVGANGSYGANGQKLFVTSFTNSGNYGRHVDIAGPGTSVVSLRDPGSYVDVFHPEGLVPVDATGRYFRGSGTSEATAVTSGVVALLLQKYPSLTPDQVKNVLMASATPLFGSTANMVGAGSLNPTAAFGFAAQLLQSGGHASGGAAAAYANLPDHGRAQLWAASTGSGSLDASRGGADSIIDGAPVTGPDTMFGTTYDPTQPARSVVALDLASWAGGSWTSSRWSGQAWAGDAWTSSRWSGDTWTSSRWSSGSWTSSRWSGAVWESADWSSHRWSGNNWGQPASQIQFGNPSGVTVDASGDVWVADTNDNQVDKFSPSGVELTILSGSGNGAGNGALANPHGLASDAAGDVYIADTNNSQVEEFTSTGTLKQVFTSSGPTGPAGLPGRLKNPSGVAVDAAGNVYVADTGNNEVVELSSTGTFVTAFTTSGEGSGSHALMLAPQSVAVDTAGYVYVADTGNNEVEMFDSAGMLVNRWKSNGNKALVSSAIRGPSGVAVDGAGHVWVADTGNNQVETITPATGAETYWTTIGNGPLAGPAALAIDATGNVYIANHGTSQIEEASPSGILLSSLGTSSAPGTGLSSPSGITIGSGGDRYIADTGDDRIVESTSTGVYLTAITGDGVAGNNLSQPEDVDVSPSGKLWVADTGNNRVEEFTPNGAFITAITTDGVNPAAGQSAALRRPVGGHHRRRRQRLCRRHRQQPGREVRPDRDLPHRHNRQRRACSSALLAFRRGRRRRRQRLRRRHRQQPGRRVRTRREADRHLGQQRHPRQSQHEPADGDSPRQQPEPVGRRHRQQSTRRSESRHRLDDRVDQQRQRHRERHHECSPRCGRGLGRERLRRRYRQQPGRPVQ